MNPRMIGLEMRNQKYKRIPVGEEEIEAIEENNKKVAGEEIEIRMIKVEETMTEEIEAIVEAIEVIGDIEEGIEAIEEGIEKEDFEAIEMTEERIEAGTEVEVEVAFTIETMDKTATKEEMIMETEEDIEDLTMMTIVVTETIGAEVMRTTQETTHRTALLLI